MSTFSNFLHLKLVLKNTTLSTHKSLPVLFTIIRVQRPTNGRTSHNFGIMVSAREFCFVVQTAANFRAVEHVRTCVEIREIYTQKHLDQLQACVIRYSV